jgi:hypothetical protein
MYETGGQVRPIGKIVLLLFIFPIIINIAISAANAIYGEKVSEAVTITCMLLYCFFVLWFFKPIFDWFRRIFTR